MSLAHEGRHIADVQGVAAGYFGPVSHITTELHAYLVTVAAAKSLNWSSVGPQGGSPFWDSSWTKVDQQTRPATEIMKFLLASPIYSGKNFTTAYTK